MILELFWPKELKELVKKYRDEGTLNEEAVKFLKCLTYKYYAISLIIIAILFFTKQFIASMVLLSLTPFFTWFDLKNLFYNQIEPYAGKKITAKFMSIKIYYAGRQRINYESTNDGKKIICNIGTKPDLKQDDWPEPHQIITVYQSKTNTNRSMPDIGYLKQKYSLTNHIL